MTEYDLGRARRLRRAYSFDDVSVVPSRRTRDAADVDLSWQIDAYRFEAPIMAAPVDSVMSPDSAAVVSDLGLLAVLGLEGLWCRYADPTAHLAEIAQLADDRATARMQQIYSQPIDLDLVAQRVRDLRSPGRSPSPRDWIYWSSAEPP
jgi:IMP dehydrogenase